MPITWEWEGEKKEEPKRISFLGRLGRGLKETYYPEEEKFLKMPWYEQIGTFRFLREVPGAVAKTFAEVPARFIKSAAEVPETLIGTAVETLRQPRIITPEGEIRPELKVREPTITRRLLGRIPWVGKLPTYQEEAAKRAGEIVAGEKPLYTALTPFAEVPLAGYTTYMMGRGVVELGKRGIQAFQRTRLNEIIKETMPPIHKKEAISLLRRGKAEKVGLMREIIPKPTTTDITRGKIIQKLGIVIKRGDPLGNEVRIGNTIGSYSDDVTSFLDDNPAPFRYQDLKASLTKTEPVSVLTKRDITMRNSYGAVKEAIIDNLNDYFKTNPTNTNNLWRGRIILDDVFNRETAGLGWKDVRLPAAYQAYRDLRTTTNNFIINRTPAPVFKTAMRDLHQLYEAADHIAQNNWRIMGSNVFQRIWQFHPNIRLLIKGGIGLGIWKGIEEAFRPRARQLKLTPTP